MAIIFAPHCAVFKMAYNRLNRACHWNALKRHDSNLSAIMSAASECFNDSLKNGLPKWCRCIPGQSKKLKLVR